MVEEHDFQLQTAISALNDVVSRIDNVHDLSEIGSIILRLEFINRWLVNLEVPDDFVNTMLILHDTTKTKQNKTKNKQKKKTWRRH